MLIPARISHSGLGTGGLGRTLDRGVRRQEEGGIRWDLVRWDGSRSGVRHDRAGRSRSLSGCCRGGPILAVGGWRAALPYGIMILSYK